MPTYKGVFRLSLLAWCLIFVGSALGQTPRTLPSPYNVNLPINYVRIWNMVGPEANADSITVSSALDKAHMTTEYLDGLGRPLQIVMKGGSLATDPHTQTSITNAKDIVLSVEYDAYGREQFKYLPFAADTAGGNTSISDGFFKLNPFAQQAAFYNSSTSTSPISGQGETFFYSQTTFEPSPLNRAIASYPAGNSWVGAAKGASEDYQFNKVSDSVRIWNVDNQINNAPTTTSVFQAGELYKNILKDEHQKSVVEYIDKEGKVILRKVQLDSIPGSGHVGWLCTYFVYDDIGHLRFVLQPKAIEALLQAGSWTISNTIRDELCFYYGYDDVGHLAVKKQPGIGEVWMVYDLNDRIVMTQDSNMRASSKWLLILYDSLNRPSQIGIVNNSSIGSKSLASHRSDARLSSAYPFDVNSTPSTGYEELIRYGYDDYSTIPTGCPLGTLATSGINSTNFLTTYNTSPTYAQPITQSTQTKGLKTWTKVKILGTSSSFLFSSNTYDANARLIQTKTTNISGGADTLTNQYDFAGKILRSFVAHTKAGSNSHQYYVLTKNSFDALGRLESISKRPSIDQSSSADDKITARYYFNSLGFLSKKNLGEDPNNLGNPLDSLTYDYNIRGWLLGVNRAYATSTTSTSNYFGFDLGFNKDTIWAQSFGVLGKFSNPQLNGNISGVVWKSRGDQEIRKYDFKYDASNRLLNADFNQFTSGAFNKDAGIDYSVYGLSYDANGNILTLTQKGWKIGGSVTIDSLQYNYSSNSNKLKNVIDLENDPTTKLGDFRSSSLYMTSLGGAKTAAATDYTYDGNSNLVTDLNKDISSYSGANGIEYNYLNLPQKITFKGSSGNDGTIDYVYDAAGNKLKKIFTNGSNVTTTLYMYGNYVNDTLQYFSHEEGRIRPVTGSDNPFTYDYYLKDYLGNIRVLLSEEQKQNDYLASMEVGDSATEQALFYNLPSTRVDRTTIADYPTTDTYTSPNTYVAKTVGSGNKIGPAIALRVMSGDHISIRVSDWYKLNGSTPSSPNPITDLVTVLASSIGNVAGPKASATELATSSATSSGVSSFLSSQTYTTSKPKAFINWIFFDDQFNFISGLSGFEQVGNDNQLNYHTLTGLPVTKNGYLYIYVSNETPNVNVYFDNLQVDHVHGPILEETHYYPFGLTMQGISSKALCSLKNKFKFNGASELENQTLADKAGAELYETDFRSYDPQIGRFVQPDPLAEVGFSWSPYCFATDNPITFNDPTGLAARDSLKAPDGQMVANAGSLDPVVVGTIVRKKSPGGPPPIDDAAILQKPIVRISLGLPALPNSPLAPVGPPGRVVPIGGAAQGAASAAGGIGLRALGTLGGVLLPLSTAHDPVLRFDPLYKQPASKPDPNGFITLYRGVRPSHPMYQEALRGYAVPLDMMGHNNPNWHNDGDTYSIFTSWTISPAVALKFATDFSSNQSHVGVVLQKTFKLTQLIPSKDEFGEGEFLAPGIIQADRVHFEKAWGIQ